MIRLSLPHVCLKAFLKLLSGELESSYNSLEWSLLFTWWNSGFVSAHPCSWQKWCGLWSRSSLAISSGSFKIKLCPQTCTSTCGGFPVDSLIFVNIVFTCMFLILHLILSFLHFVGGKLFNQISEGILKRLLTLLDLFLNHFRNLFYFRLVTLLCCLKH